MNGKKYIWIAATCVVFGNTSASAQVLAGEEVKKEAMSKEAKDEGFKLKGSLGLTASFNDSQNVPGVTDGSTFQGGLTLNLEKSFIRGQHEWRSTLSLLEAQTKTPQFDQFIKSQDLIELNSYYYYRLKRPDWLGPYARFQGFTNLLNGYLVKAADTTVNRGGEAPETVSAGEKIPLTSAFKPLTLRQAIGAFAQPLKDKKLTLGFEAGFGAQQVIWGSDGYAVASDDGAAATLTLVEGKGANTLGPEAGVKANGVTWIDRLTWFAGARVYYPVITPGEYPFEGSDRLNVDLDAGASMKLSGWLSLDYKITAKKVPEVTGQDFQVQNNLILTAGFNLI